MAVDIWLARLKIANVGRASPEKIIKHFLEQAPWEISNSKSWKNNENVNKTLHLPHCAGTALFVKFIYTYPHMDSAVFVRVNSRGSVGDLFGYRVLPAWVRTRLARGTVCAADDKNSYDITYVMGFSGRIGHVMLSSLLSLYQGGKLAFWQGQDHQIATRGNKGMLDRRFVHGLVRAAGKTKSKTADSV